MRSFACDLQIKKKIMLHIARNLGPDTVTYLEISVQAWTAKTPDYFFRGPSNVTGWVGLLDNLPY